jgi:hypothetical protein
MGYQAFVLASILLATTAYAKEPKAYQSGDLLQMDSVQCATNEKQAAKNSTQEHPCQEYVLQAEQVIYRIRPRDAKHPVLLPIGERAQFRLDKNKMLVRVEYLDSKEREYTVVSMAPRGESTADATQVRLNHLQ